MNTDEQSALIENIRADQKRAARKLDRAISQGRFIRTARIAGDIATLSTGREYLIDPHGTYRRVGKH